MTIFGLSPATKKDSHDSNFFESARGLLLPAKVATIRLFSVGLWPQVALPLFSLGL